MFWWISFSALSDAIGNIVSLSTNEQVVRVYASGIITMMTHVNTARAFAIMKKVSSLMREIRVLHHIESSISILVDVALPFPAFVGQSKVSIAPHGLLERMIFSCRIWDKHRNLVSGGPQSVPSTAAALFIDNKIIAYAH